VTSGFLGGRPGREPAEREKGGEGRIKKLKESNWGKRGGKNEDLAEEPTGMEKQLVEKRTCQIPFGEGRAQGGKKKK